MLLPHIKPDRFVVQLTIAVISKDFRVPTPPPRWKNTAGTTWAEPIHKLKVVVSITIDDLKVSPDIDISNVDVNIHNSI